VIIDLLEADGLERLGHVGDDRANILDVLGSGTYYLAGSEYEKSSFRGLDSVDETGELLLVVLRTLQLSFNFYKIELVSQLCGYDYVLYIYFGDCKRSAPL
jgi:hypothetical protein